MHRFARRGVKVSFRELIRFGVSRNHAHVIAIDDVFASRQTERKATFALDVGDAFMGFVKRKNEDVAGKLSAPSGIHEVDASVLVIGGDHLNHLRR